MPHSDIIVIGGGPAGLAAAITAAGHHAKVTLIDEQHSPGGQIYRNLANADTKRATVFGKDYLYGKKLLSQLQHTNIDFISRATVWSVTEQGRVTYSRHNKAQQVEAPIVIVATGALERPYPIPGWTLPGVMTAGAAQILLKSSGVIAAGPVLAGTGPLLYAVANQLLALGGQITAIVDTISPEHYRRAISSLPLSNIPALYTGLSYLQKIKSAGVPHYRHCTNIEVIGTHTAEGVRFSCNGLTKDIRSTSVLLHQGVVPNVQLSRSLGLKHRWHALQRCFHPDIDNWGVTSMPAVRIAGDGGGIGGAIVAEHHGAVVALEALATLKIINRAERDQLAASHQRAIRRMKKLRLFLDKLYSPPAQCYQPADDTIVCRCEEVTAKEIRAVARLGGAGPNQTKSFCRSGMGPCQGRYCGNSVTEILAAAHGQPHDNVGYYRIRSPIKPVTLQELASLHKANSSRQI